MKTNVYLKKKTNKQKLLNKIETKNKKTHTQLNLSLLKLNKNAVFIVFYFFNFLSFFQMASHAFELFIGISFMVVFISMKAFNE